MQWEIGIEHLGLLSLLFMSNFGRTKEVDIYIKQLLVVFHACFLWLEMPYSIDVDLISSITGFPKTRGDPAPYLRPNQDTTKMKQKYKLQHVGRGFIIYHIEDNMVRFVARILSCKLLCKMRPDEWIIGVIEITEQCTTRVIFN